MLAVLLSLTLVAAACSDDDEDDGGDGGDDDTQPPRRPKEIDYEAIGLWDDGPCDAAKEPLKIGLMTVFESPVLSLEDQATALEVVRRGVQQAGRRQRLVRRGHHLRRRRQRRPGGGVRAGDRRRRRGGHRQRPGHRRPGARCRTPWPTAGIPRVASNVDPGRLGRSERLPARRVRHRRHLPDAAGAHRRRREEDRPHPGRPAAGVARSSASSRTPTRATATFPYDVPVPGGTTDFSQFILGAQDDGSGRRRPGARRAGGRPDREGRPAAGHRAAHRLEPRHVLAQERHRAGRLQQADGVHVVLPAGDHRPAGLRGAPRRPRGLGRGRAPAREPQGQPDAVVDRPLRPAQDDPRRRA